MCQLRNEPSGKNLRVRECGSYLECMIVSNKRLLSQVQYMNREIVNLAEQLLYCEGRWMFENEFGF